MHFRTTLALTALSLALVTALTAGTADAQGRDRARLRYGVAVEAGGVFAPGVVDLGFVGVQGQLGVQLNNLFAIYAAPNVDVLSGPRGQGFQVGGALMFDFTIAHVFTIGIGPQMTGFTAFGSGELAAGALYGTRLHLAVNPLVDISRRGARRNALVLAVDFCLCASGAGMLSAERATASQIVTSPTFLIGFQGF